MRIARVFLILNIVLSLFVMGSVDAGPIQASKKNFDQITDGMTKDQVMQILGRPDYIQTYGMDPDTTWEYSNFSSRRFAIDFTPAGIVHNIRMDSSHEE